MKKRHSLLATLIALIFVLALGGATLAFADGGADKGPVIDYTPFWDCGGFEDGAGYFSDGNHTAPENFKKIGNNSGTAEIVSDSHKGETALKISGADYTQAAIVRLAYGNPFSIGKTYKIDFWAKGSEAGTFVLYSNFVENNASYDAHISQLGYKNIGTAYEHVTGDITVNQNDADYTVIVNFDGGSQNAATAMPLTISGGIAAVDLMIGINTASEIYIDDLTINEMYDAEVTVNGKDGLPIADATFTATDYNGETLSISPVYADGKYTFTGLYCPVTITAWASGEIIDSTQLSANKTSAILSAVAPTLDITVKDDAGNVIMDATVKFHSETGETQTIAITSDKYTIEDASDGRITIAKEGYASEEIYLPYSDAECTVTLKETFDTSELDDNDMVCGGFEDFGAAYAGNAADVGWQFGAWHSNVNPGGHCLYEETDMTHSGTSSAKMTYGAVVYRYRAFGMLSVKNRTWYTTTFYARSAVNKEVGLSLEIGVYGLSSEEYKDIASYSVGNEWTEYTFRMKFDYDDNEFTLKLDTGSGDMVFGADNDGQWLCNATDLILKVGDTDQAVYIDDFVFYEEYEAEVEVTDAAGTPIDDAEITATRYDGAPLDVTVAFNEDDGIYKVSGLYGTAELTIKTGEKTTEVTVSADENFAEISEEYTGTVTVKDTDGNVITGATVVGKKGGLVKATFIDRGNGIYEAGGLMGEYSVVITKDGFKEKTVTIKASANSQEVVLEAVPADQVNNGGEVEKKGCSGCKSSAAAVSIPAAALFIAVAAALTAKRKKA